MRIGIAGAWAMAVLVSLATGLGGYLVLRDARWEPPEQPRAQGEALRMRADGQIDYREEIAAAGIREVQNTWTNLAYVFVGSLIILRSELFRGRMLGGALVFLGVGSGLYHASLLPAWRLIDVIGMYWVIYTLMAYCMGRISDGRIDAWLSLAVAVLAFGTAVFRNDIQVFGVKIFDSTYVTIAGFVVVGGSMAKSLVGRGLGRAGKAFAVIGLMLAAVAAAGQLGDRPGNFWFGATAIPQGHSVWHVAGAAAILCAFEVARNWTGDRGLTSD